MFFAIFFSRWTVVNNSRNKRVTTFLLYFIGFETIKFYIFFIKGNAQFLFLCNPPKSGASWVCITYPQTTQKILTKYIFRWLKVITEILSFLQIFSVRKTTTQLFKYFRKSARKSTQMCISGKFWAFKIELQIIHVAAYIALSLPDSNNCFLYV